MIKKILVAALLLSMVSSLQAQKKWFDQAMKKGRQGTYYVIDNTKRKEWKMSEFLEYAEKNNYVVGSYTEQKINKFGEYINVVRTIEFIPRRELWEQWYNLMPVSGKPSFAELKQEGKGFCFRGIVKGDRAKMNDDELNGMVNLASQLKYDNSCGNYLFENIPNLLWSGDVKDGLLDGTGVAFGKPGYSNRWFYCKGTFKNGFPVGECTCYWYVNPTNTCCDGYKLRSHTVTLSCFEGDDAKFKGDGYEGYVNRNGFGCLFAENGINIGQHALAWVENNNMYFYYFGTNHSEKDRTKVLDILKNKKTKDNAGNYFGSNSFSIPYFFIEDLSGTNNKYSKEQFAKVFADIKKYCEFYEKSPVSKKLDSVLCRECRRHGMLYEYVCYTKNPVLLTAKERAAVADRIYNENYIATVVGEYLSFFPNGKYKGQDLKLTAERAEILSSKPTYKYERWVQTYIDNAHDILKRNDARLWEEVYGGDLSKYALLTENVGCFMTWGVFGLFPGTGYVFPAATDVKWYPGLFEQFKKEKTKNIEEALKYKALMDGIALANRVDGHLLMQVQDNESYYCSLDNKNIGYQSSHRERMREAISVAREFAVSKPELAPACRKADSLITEKMEAIEETLARVRGRWDEFFASRAKIFREINCEGCEVLSETSPSLLDDDHKRSEKEGVIIMKNHQTTEWIYKREYGRWNDKVVIEANGFCSGTFKSYDEMIDAIIKACVKEYCD